MDAATDIFCRLSNQSRQRFGNINVIRETKRRDDGYATAMNGKSPFPKSLLKRARLFGDHDIEDRKLAVRRNSRFINRTVL
jgi:hypothetical protein